VGHAPRQRADTLHLLSLEELALHLLVLADVAEDADEMRQLPLAVHDRRHRQ